MSPSSANRVCGDCQLCCKLLPVEELNKKSGTRCHNQRSSMGCTIYPNRPMSCRVWSCRWLVDPATLHMLRPDRSHYVIDILPDTVRINEIDDDGSPRQTDIPAVVVWVDPKHPDAHRDYRLRNWLDRINMVAIIRYDESNGFVLFPPKITGIDPDTGNPRGWVEHASSVNPELKRETVLEPLYHKAT